MKELCYLRLVCNVLLFSAQLSCGVFEESRSERDRFVKHFRKASKVPRWSHLVVYRRRCDIKQLLRGESQL